MKEKYVVYHIETVNPNDIVAPACNFCGTYKFPEGKVYVVDKIEEGFGAALVPGKNMNKLHYCSLECMERGEETDEFYENTNNKFKINK